MKKYFILILISFYYISANSQNFSLSENNSIFNIENNVDVISDTSFLITHSNSQTIDPGTSVSCNSSQIHFDNSYYRVFELFGEHFNLNGDWSVQKIQIGISEAVSGTGTSQPGMLILSIMSEYDGNSIVRDSLSQKGDTIFFDIHNYESGTIKEIEINPLISIPFGSVLVVEVLIPDGHENNHKLFIGSNDIGQTDNTYIRAPECGVENPINTEEIGYPDMMLVLNVIGTYDSATPEIQSFNIEGQLVDTEIINIPDFEINIVMPTEESLDALTPQITVPAGFYITPLSGETVDFSQPVEYNVTNEYNKISQTWLVHVNNAGPDIYDVQIEGQNGLTIIDNENHTVTVPVPFETNLTDVSPEIFIYDGFIITPGSQISQDFSSGAVTYNVSNESLSLSQDWEISVFEYAGSMISNLNKQDIVISPNPASNFLNISGLTFSKIDIINFSGKQIFSTDNSFIDLSEFSNGIYFLLINTDNGVVLKKVVIIK